VSRFNRLADRPSGARNRSVTIARAETNSRSLRWHQLGHIAKPRDPSIGGHQRSAELVIDELLRP
jgi:hypothetical protein